MSHRRPIMKITKKALTLIEVMIVICIIGIIGSVIGYNMKGSLDEGRSFKSEQGSKQVYDLLMLSVANGESIDEIIENPEVALTRTGFVKSPQKLIKDGWGGKYIIEAKGTEDISVTSNRWINFLRDKKQYTEDRIKEDYPWVKIEPDEDL